MIELHPLEILPITLYLLFLLIIGFRSRHSHRDEADFIVGGRQLTLPAFVATLVTTWYGGILGVGEFTYLYGLSNWVVFGLPYYLFAILFGLVLAPKIQQAQLLSIPDQLFLHYGKSSGFVGTLFTFFMTLPAPYVLMIGFLIHLITGWSLWICLILGTLFSMVYVLNGGFRAVVRTDKLQFVLMFGGFAVMFGVLLSRYGGLDFLKTHLPPLHLSWHGGHSVQYILVWFFIALWTLIDPGFHQRCYAARTPQTARRGILLSVLFWAIFDLLTTATGLYARALLPDIEPALSYPWLSHRILPPLLSGIFYSGLLATIMSTLDSNFLLSAVTLGHDLLGKFTTQETRRIQFTRVGLILSALLSIGLALLFPSVIQLWYLIGTLFIPPMLIPVLGSYFPLFRLTPSMAFLNLTGSFLSSLFLLGMSLHQSSSTEELHYWLGIQPMFGGLVFSLGIWIVEKVRKR